MHLLHEDALNDQEYEGELSDGGRPSEDQMM